MSEDQSYEQMRKYYKAVAGWAELDINDPEDRAELVKRAEDENIVFDPEDDDSLEDAREELRDSLLCNVLSVDVRVIKTVVLGTGGPEYGFEAECDPDAGGEVTNIRFYYQDWYQPRIYLDLDQSMQQFFIDLFGLEF